LLFELIYQRTANQSRLLIVLDEPFAGVTDDFVPWIVERLNRMRQTHNVLLVTNDHVETLTNMADNTITVSAIDRTKVQINHREAVDREKAILALSVGDEYVYTANQGDLKFFVDVEILHNGAILGIAGFSVFAFGLFLATFWNSNESSAVLVLIAGGIIAYFAINPYLLSLVDWRNYMSEEAEALLHASKSMNKLLKTLLTMSMICIISLIEFGCVNAGTKMIMNSRVVIYLRYLCTCLLMPPLFSSLPAVINGLSSVDYWVAMLFDSGSLTFPMLCFGLYTDLPHQAVQIFGSMPFLFMIFFSTTFSPGSGVAVLKELRYLFARFYFWCMVPGVDIEMEGCPESESANLLYLCLSGLLGVFLFLVVMGILGQIKKAKKAKAANKLEKLYDDEEFQALQLEMYGAKNLRKLQHLDSSMGLSQSYHGDNSRKLEPFKTTSSSSTSPMHKQASATSPDDTSGDADSIAEEIDV
jgi:hypothetical protein